MTTKSKKQIFEELHDEYSKEIERINMLVSRNKRLSITRELNEQEKGLDEQLKMQLGLLLDLVAESKKSIEAEEKTEVEKKPTKIEK